MRGFFLYLDTIKELFYFWNKSNEKKGGSILIFHKYCMFCTLFSIQHPFTHSSTKKNFNFIFLYDMQKIIKFFSVPKNDLQLQFLSVCVCICIFFLMFSLKKNIANYSQRLFFFTEFIHQPFFNLFF